eukprot:TRINITY_DN5_c0_g2_i3.p1 TRINITY_DN5_c0_g2~~TRINITY_DN5_c0_g2_i3.p1  ORF type:complete len:927 (-),score=71.65 TRINITY_DN5_c0_g2_i3:1430-4210(-)
MPRGYFNFLSCLLFSALILPGQSSIPTSDEELEQVLKAPQGSVPSGFETLMYKKFGPEVARRKLEAGLPALRHSEEVLQAGETSTPWDGKSSGPASEDSRRRLGSYSFRKGLAAPGRGWGPTEATTNLTIFRMASVNNPYYVDWRMFIGVTPVHDQGNCDSCWAMVTADAISYLSYIVTQNNGNRWPGAGFWYGTSNQWWPNYGMIAVNQWWGNLLWQGSTSRDASPQQICDCGLGSCCSGGWPEWALSYAAAMGGLSSWNSYPYTAASSTQCLLKSNYVPTMVATGWEAIPAYSITKLMKAVAQTPVIAFLSASSPAFLNYPGGLFTGPCSTAIDHVVLIVGYGNDTIAGRYWIIKNTWGPNWGVNGYMYLQIAEGKGVCGIQSTYSLYPTYSPPGNTNPCNFYPSPCGSGACYTQLVNGSQVGRCTCPPGYVENRMQYPAKCIPYDPCTYTGVNPCGNGVCTPLADGQHSCTCGVGTFVGATAAGSPVCVNGTSSSAIKTYKVNDGDTCGTITLSYNMLLGTFIQYNTWVDCSNPNNPLPAGAVVAVTNTTTTTGCTSSYTVQIGDNCTSITSSQPVSLGNLLNLNPTLDCSTSLALGMQLCLTMGTLAVPTPPPPTCGYYYTVNATNYGAGSTCTSISTFFDISLANLTSFNPGLQCGPTNTAIIPQGTVVCTVPYKAPVPFNCTKTYAVQHGDSCPLIWLANNITEAALYLMNPNLNCQYPNLQIGQQICVSSPSVTNTPSVPYLVQYGDTLEIISANFINRCVNATVLNILIQNNLKSATLKAGQALLIPCMDKVGVDGCSGCPGGEWWCGQDNSAYNSKCSASCHGALPATSGYCANCVYGCANRAAAKEPAAGYSCPTNGQGYCPCPSASGWTSDPNWSSFCSFWNAQSWNAGRETAQLVCGGGSCSQNFHDICYNIYC